MSTDTASDLIQSAKPERRAVTPDSLWPWYLVTALYLSICSFVLYDRAAEFGEFLNPADNTGGRLRLNEIGDIAAGVFAPLAFLWLFVATQLQRRELRLQREELAETRAVLAEQQRELEKAATESNKQTEIMNKTLVQASYKEDYDLFGLDLYYLAKHCLQVANNPLTIFTPVGTKITTSTLDVPASYEFSPNDISTVDDFFYMFVRHIRNLQINHHALSLDTTVARFSDTELNMRQTISILDSLKRVKSTTGNELVRSRYNALHLDELLVCLKIFFES